MVKKNTPSQAFVSGNEALARGAYEAGLSVACAHPGAPSAEILEALADVGGACALQDALAVSAPDQPGNFHKLTSVLATNNISLTNAYGFVLQPHRTGVCCMEIEPLQLSEAAQAVGQAGFAVLEDEELYNL